MIKDNAMLALGTIDWYSNYNLNIAIARYIVRVPNIV